MEKRDMKITGGDQTMKDRVLDVGWYGDKYIITVEDDSGNVLEQVSLTEQEAVTLKECLCDLETSAHDARIFIEDA